MRHTMNRRRCTRRYYPAAGSRGGLIGCPRNCTGKYLKATNLLDALHLIENTL
jgi:hypothetical protein